MRRDIKIEFDKKRLNFEKQKHLMEEGDKDSIGYQGEGDAEDIMDFLERRLK